MSSPAEPIPTRRVRPLRRAAVMVGAFALAVLAAEVAWRVRLRAGGTPWSAGDGFRRIAEVLAETLGTIATEAAATGLAGVEGDVGDADPAEDLTNFQLHPYYGYEVAGGLNAQGKIREYYADGRADGELSVLVLGGSVAAHFTGGGNVGAREELEQRLTADPRAGGRSARVVPHARPGFKQPQQLHALVECLRQGIRPDAVINLDGYNELQLPHQNLALSMRADWPSAGHWAHLGGGVPTPGELDLAFEARAAGQAAERLADAARRWRLAHSALAGSLVLRRLEGLRDRAHAAGAAYTASRAGGGGAAVDIEGALPDLVATWRACSLEMHRLCEAHGIAYVHALQPTLHDRGSKPVTAEERGRGLRTGWRPALVEGYPLLRAAGAELAAEGVRFVDLSQAFAEVTTTLYYDPCHFHKEGNLLLVEPLAEAVLEALEHD